MTFNLRHSDKPGTPKGDRQSAHSTPMPRKAQSVLRAYYHAPKGQEAAAVARALSNLHPLPSAREAVQLTNRLPGMIQSQALARFSAHLEAQEETNGCADGGRGHYDPCQCPRKHKERKGGEADGGKDEQPQKPSQAFTTPDRFRGIFGAHVPAQIVHLDRRVGEALAILRGPGDPDAHIQAIARLLFSEVVDVQERTRRASRFLLRAILSGATSEPPKPKDWSAAEPQPFDVDRFLSDEGRGV